MKTVGGLAIAVAVAAMLVCARVRAEEASVLLEAGVYAEEVVGDLDKAIETYRQITADAGANRRCVAEAHYRLGKCYLAKGDREKAREQFTLVAERYPDQEALVGSASRELAKLQPPAPPSGEPTFGPVVDLPPDFGRGKNVLVDFESGKVHSLDELDASAATLRAFGVDAGCDTAGDKLELTGFDAGLLPCAADAWDRLSPAELVALTLSVAGAAPLRFSFGRDKLPAVYAFKTAEGGRGLLQFREAGGEPARGVTVRYKMLQAAERASAALTFGPVIERTVNCDERSSVDTTLDLETGRLFAPGPEVVGKAFDDSVTLAWIRDTGADFVGYPVPGRPDEVAVGLGLSTVSLPKESWDRATPGDVIKALSAQTPPLPGALSEIRIDPEAGLPASIGFRTSAGSYGLMQVTGMDPDRVRIRYKMVQGTRGPTASDAALLAAAEEIRHLGIVLDMYRRDTGAFPTTAQGLAALIAPPAGVTNWNGPYVKPVRVPRDPWGNPYQYAFPGGQSPDLYDLRSGGPDGTLGTADDISNRPAQPAAASSSAALADLRIRLADAKAELGAATAEDEFARHDLARKKGLFEQGVVTETDLDRAQADRARASAAVDAARQKMKILTEEIQRIEGGSAPASEPLAFGPAIERRLGGWLTNLIDLDSGQIYGLRFDPEGDPARQMQWLDEHGIDGLYRHLFGSGGSPFSFVGCRVANVAAASWETVTPQQVVAALGSPAAALASEDDHGVAITKLNETGDFVPHTRIFAFRTRAGGRGVLQVLGQVSTSDTVTGFTIRYKMLVKVEPGAGVGTPALLPSAAGHLADLRLRLTDAQADLTVAGLRREAAENELKTLQKLAAAGRVDQTKVEEATRASEEAAARTEAAQEKVKILSDEIARLEAESTATPAAANEAGLADLRLRLAEAQAELLRSASLLSRMELQEPHTAVGLAPQTESEAAKQTAEANARMAAARKRIDVLKDAIAQLEGATQHVPTALEVAGRFVELLRSGQNDAELVGLAEPGRGPDPKTFLPKFRQYFDVSGFAIAEFWLADQDACAVTSVLQPVSEDGKPTALGIGLRKSGDRWLVRDMDALPTEQSRKEFVQGFRDAHPSARQVPPQSPLDGP